MGVNRCIFVFLGVNDIITFIAARRVIEDNIICKRDKVKSIELTKYDFLNGERFLSMMVEDAKKYKVIIVRDRGWIVHTLDERTMTPGYVDKRYKELFEEFFDTVLENAVCPLLLAVDLSAEELIARQKHIYLHDEQMKPIIKPLIDSINIELAREYFL